MKIGTDQKKMLVLAGIGLAIFLSVGLFVWKGSELTQQRAPQARVQEIMRNGVDVSRSLFPQEDKDAILAKIEERKARFLSGSETTAQNLMDMARAVRDLRDYDKALALFAVVDTINPPDKFYKVDEGNIYLERQQWEEARLLYEPLRMTLPIHEIYIGLTKAYQNLEGTPDYVIEDIYKEGLWRTGKFELMEEYVKWLESKDREADTLPLYERMNALAPQPILENKINELKAKYAK